MEDKFTTLIGFLCVYMCVRQLCIFIDMFVFVICVYMLLTLYPHVR